MAADVGPGGQELAVDRIRCDGRGLCAELLPELVRLDDWGYPIVAPGPVPDHLLDYARRAVAACPVLALALRRSQRSPRIL
jgi:ferredoxin